MRNVIGLVLVGLIGGSLYALIGITRTPNPEFVREIPVATSDDGSVENNRTPASVDTFAISDALLAQLESHREHLAEYAHAEPSAGGWRIHLVSGEPVFSKAGFHDGQFISFGMLKAVSEQTNRPELAERMVDVLRSIEQ
jgi:hypothetical protein